MPNYSTNLKTWGSNGQEPPDNYSYVEGEQPVDAWDNFFNSNVVSDIEHLINVTNNELLARDGSVSMAGNLDMDGNTIESSTSQVNLESGATISSNDIWHEGNDGAGTGLNADEIHGLHPSDGAGGQVLGTDGSTVSWVTESSAFKLADGSGSVNSGDVANIYTGSVGDGESIDITRSTFTNSDGTAIPSGCDLIIATLDNSGGGTSQQTVLSGDGSTVFDLEEGSPLASYTNSSGGAQTIMVGVDNGHFNSGTGSIVDASAVVEVNIE